MQELKRKRAVRRTLETGGSRSVAKTRSRVLDISNSVEQVAKPPAYEGFLPSLKGETTSLAKKRMYYNNVSHEDKEHRYSKPWINSKIKLDQDFKDKMVVRQRPRAHLTPAAERQYEMMDKSSRYKKWILNISEDNPFYNIHPTAKQLQDNLGAMLSKQHTKGHNKL